MRKLWSVFRRKVKRKRAQGECLGIRSRRRTWQAAKSFGELQMSDDPEISECGNTHGQYPCIVQWINPLVWPPPRSLATTCGISVDVFSSSYLDVSVQTVPLVRLFYSPHDNCTSAVVLPHSDISGSTLICSSPKLFAACHVLHRLLMPRHSPCALISLTFIKWSLI